jgi:hypothetical protein
VEAICFQCFTDTADPGGDALNGHHPLDHAATDRRTAGATIVKQAEHELRAALDIVEK